MLLEFTVTIIFLYRKIFVGGISSDTQNQDLQTFFGKYGEVTKVEVKIDRITGRSRGFAFVEFATSEACRKVLSVNYYCDLLLFRWLLFITFILQYIVGIRVYVPSRKLIDPGRVTPFK